MMPMQAQAMQLCEATAQAIQLCDYDGHAADERFEREPALHRFDFMRFSFIVSLCIVSFINSSQEVLNLEQNDRDLYL